MKKLLTILLTLFLFNPVYAVSPKNTELNAENGVYESSRLKWKSGLAYAEGESAPLTGVVINKYENGNILVKTSFVDGLENGKEFWYRKNGDIEKQKVFVNGEEHGLEKSWYKTQQPDWEKTWKNGKKIHSKKFYKNGDIKIENLYKDGKRIKRTKYRKGGWKEAVTIWTSNIRGDRTYTFKKYPETKLDFIDGIAYVPNTTTKFTGRYGIAQNKSLPLIITKIPCESGNNIHSGAEYEDGLLHGKYFECGSSGELLFIKQNVNKKTTENGVLFTTEKQAKELKLVKIIKWEINSGKVVNQLDYRNGVAYAKGDRMPFNGIHKWYFSQKNKNKIGRETHYINGLKHGKETLWWGFGDIRTISNFVKGKKQSELYRSNIATDLNFKNNLAFDEITGNLFNGEFIDFFNYGGDAIKSRTPYSNGVKNGLQTKWNNNNNKKSDIHWKDGVKDGAHIDYDGYGLIKYTFIYRDGNLISTKEGESVIKAKEKLKEIARLLSKSMSDIDSDETEVKNNAIKNLIWICLRRTVVLRDPGYQACSKLVFGDDIARKNAVNNAIEYYILNKQWKDQNYEKLDKIMKVNPYNIENIDVILKSWMLRYMFQLKKN